MSKNIRSKVVRESLLDYNTLANSLKENTESAVKSLLDEAVRDTYAKLLSEGNEEDYEEEEVEDTSSDIANDAESSEAPTDGVEDADAGMDADSLGTEGEDGTEPDEMAGETAEEGEVADAIDGVSDEGEDGDEWAEFDKYKVSDDEYDFSNAEDEEIVKVYKLMKNDDQILVHKDDNGNVNIQDNETGAEYLIKLDDEGEATGVESDDEVITDDSAEDDFENNDYDDMNESTERMFELVLEYDSNVGYTDNYQKKDVMTNPGMSEPGKNVNDWDAGVPHGTEKPWSGYPGKKNKADKPFNAGKGKQVEEELNPESLVQDGEDMEMPVAESAGEMGAKRGAHGRMTGTKSHNSSTGGYPYQQHHVSVAGEYKGDDPTGENVKENFMRRANKVLSENKELKSTLTEVMQSLKEAAVTNHNLAQIIKLISENTTSQDEKKEIISRFSKEAKTIEASKNLYESISRDLKKSNKMNITEDKNLSVESSKKINETTIYKSQDMLDSLDLMHRMMR